MATFIKFFSLHMHTNNCSLISFSFRLGRLYRYEVEKYDIDSISSFITGWYKNVQGESIPLPKTPL